jgi:hypothetical protein
MATDVSDKEIQQWISEELKQHGTFLVDRFVAALDKNKNVDTGALRSSFSQSVAFTPDGITLTLQFFTYGRYIEIAARRRKKHKEWEKKNGQVWNGTNRKPKKVQWYNKNRYAGYGRLIRTLTAGMSDAELQRIRGIIEEAKATIEKA